MRFARKVDSTQAEIIEGLRAVGIEVHVIGEPCDLLVIFSCPRHNMKCKDTLECKPLIGKKNPKARIRTDQAEQTEFLKRTDTPVVTSSLEALLALSLRHGLCSGLTAGGS